MMTKMWTFTIPSLPSKECSPNARVGWAVRYRANRAAVDEIIAEVRMQGWVGTPLEHAVISIKFGLPDKRARDMDNLIAAAKPYLDGLKGLVIQDDSYKHIKVTYDWFLSPRKPQTVITVRDDA